MITCLGWKETDMREINISNKEQLCFLGRAILNDLLIQNQSEVKSILQDIGKVIKEYTSIEQKIWSKDFLESLKKGRLKPLIEKLIACADNNKYDFQETTNIDALSEYIIEQIFIVPHMFSNGFYDINNNLRNYYNETGQAWFIEYQRSIKDCDASLSLHQAIQNIINKLLIIDKLVYQEEVKHKLDHIPLPRISYITALIDKLERMINKGECIYDLYNKQQMVIYKLIPVLKQVKDNYDDLREYMLANNIANVAQIPYFKKILERYSIVLQDKLPETTKQLDSIFYSQSVYKGISDSIFVYYNDKERMMLRSKNVEYLSSPRELFLLRSDLINLLKNCVTVQCIIDKTEVHSKLNHIMEKLEKELKDYRENQLLQYDKLILSEELKGRKDLETEQEHANSFLVMQFNAEKLKVEQRREERLMQQSEEQQCRGSLEEEYNNQQLMLVSKFNAEKSKIESESKKQLIQKLIDNPLLLDGISRSNKEGRKVITITFDFTDLEGKKNRLQLDECQCAEKFQRKQSTKVQDYRSDMEFNIVKSISKNISDKSEQINLACVGSDLFGLTIILAKLYKEGYTKFNIINIEKEISSNTVKSLEELKERRSLDSNCEKFWQWLFNHDSKSKIVFKTTSEKYPCFFLDETNNKIFVFAEDLNSTGTSTLYNNTLIEIAKTINKVNQNAEVFLTQFDTEIYELKKLQHGFLEYSNALKRSSS